MDEPINRTNRTRLQIDFEPIGRRVLADSGLTILEAAHQAGIDIISLCGGVGTCNSCRVRLLAGQLSELTSDEVEVFNHEELSSGWR